MGLQGIAWQTWLRGVVLAGPVMFFPFARAYYIFYVLILGIGLARVGLRNLWREETGLRLAMLLFIVPILLTSLVLTVTTGHVEKVWLEKAAVFILAGLMGLAAAGMTRDRDAGRVAQVLIVAAVLSWLADGSLQLFTGSSIGGRGLDSPDGQRLTAYFTHPMKFGFFVGMMALLPAFFLAPKRRGLLMGSAVLVVAGLLTMAGGSRFGLLTFLLGAGLFTVLQSLALPPLQRRLIWVAGPLLVLLAVAVAYKTSAIFEARVEQTAQVLSGLTYDSVNKATSYRLDIWYPTVELAKDHLLFGVGPGQFTEAVKPYLAPDNIYARMGIDIMHTHQVLLETWVTTGLVGLLAFLAFYAWLLREMVRHANARATMGWAALLVFALMWFPLGTQNNFYASEMTLFSFYLLGIGLGWLTPPRAAPPD
jgi:O-antigen ligase